MAQIGQFHTDLPLEKKTTWIFNGVIKMLVTFSLLFVRFPRPRKVGG